jgi:hypothetical protein
MGYDWLGALEKMQTDEFRSQNSGVGKAASIEQDTPLYVSAKRTHFKIAYFLFYHA